MVKDTCKQERKTQLQQVAFSRQAMRHTQKGQQPQLRVHAGAGAKQWAGCRWPGETCLQDGHNPSGRPQGVPAVSISLACAHQGACSSGLRPRRAQPEAPLHPTRSPLAAGTVATLPSASPQSRPKPMGCVSGLMVTFPGRQQSSSLGASSPEGMRRRHNQSLPGRLTRKCSAHVTVTSALYEKERGGGCKVGTRGHAGIASRPLRGSGREPVKQS